MKNIDLFNPEVVKTALDRIVSWDKKGTVCDVRQFNDLTRDEIARRSLLNAMEAEGWIELRQEGVGWTVHLTESGHRQWGLLMGHEQKKLIRDIEVVIRGPIGAGKTTVAAVIYGMFNAGESSASKGAIAYAEDLRRQGLIPPLDPKSLLSLDKLTIIEEHYDD